METAKPRKRTAPYLWPSWLFALLPWIVLVDYGILSEMYRLTYDEGYSPEPEDWLVIHKRIWTVVAIFFPIAAPVCWEMCRAIPSLRPPSHVVQIHVLVFVSGIVACLVVRFFPESTSLLERN